VLPIGIPLKGSHARIDRRAEDTHLEEMTRATFLGSNLPDVVALGKRSRHATGRPDRRSSARDRCVADAHTCAI
jgi:hypothetical protein